MIVLQFVVGALALVALAACICRLDAMTWRTHQASVISMHIGLGIGCAWALYSASTAQITLGDVGIVVGAVCWIWISLPTWGDGLPPKWTETGASELDRLALRAVVGGRKDE